MLMIGIRGEYQNCVYIRLGPIFHGTASSQCTAEQPWVQHFVRGCCRCRNCGPIALFWGNNSSAGKQQCLRRESRMILAWYSCPSPSVFISCTLCGWLFPPLTNDFYKLTTTVKLQRNEAHLQGREGHPISNPIPQVQSLGKFCYSGYFLERLHDKKVWHPSLKPS